MAMSYSYEIQAKVFDRMTALEEKLARPAGAVMLPDFTNPALAARAWAEQYEAPLLAEQTKAEIGSRRKPRTGTSEPPRCGYPSGSVRRPRHLDRKSTRLNSSHHSIS